MMIKEVLRRKGSAVATIDGAATVADLVARLAEHGVGAMVVVDADGSLCGIVSERDVVRRLADHGTELLGWTVDAIMTRDVATCGPDDDVRTVMRTMTDRRIRHVPVIAADGLGGIVSIGDVVKIRIDELQTTNESLESYITGG